MIGLEPLIENKMKTICHWETTHYHISPLLIYSTEHFTKCEWLVQFCVEVTKYTVFVSPLFTNNLIHKDLPTFCNNLSQKQPYPLSLTIIQKWREFTDYHRSIVITGLVSNCTCNLGSLSTCTPCTRQKGVGNKMFSSFVGYQVTQNSK